MKIPSGSSLHPEQGLSFRPYSVSFFCPLPACLPVGFTAPSAQTVSASGHSFSILFFPAVPSPRYFSPWLPYFLFILEYLLLWEISVSFYPLTIPHLFTLPYFSSQYLSAPDITSCTCLFAHFWSPSQEHTLCESSNIIFLDLHCIFSVQCLAECLVLSRHSIHGEADFSIWKYSFSPAISSHQLHL